MENKGENIFFAANLQNGNGYKLHKLHKLLREMLF